MDGVQPQSMNDEFNAARAGRRRYLQPPLVKFKDFEAMVSSRIVRDQLHFHYRFDFLRITSDTDLVPITVQYPEQPDEFSDQRGRA